MSNTVREKDAGQEKESQKKKHRGSGLLVLLIIFIILLLITTAVLGARLYEMATRDQYTVDLGLGEVDGSIELFRIQYENARGEITVQGVNTDNVVAPGTSVSYDIRLRNNDDVIIDFLMTPYVNYMTKDAVPVEFKIKDDYGNYILGSDTKWVTPATVNALAHKGTIHPGEVFTYHVTWRWVFEVSGAQNNYDTYLGNQTGANVPGVVVGIETEASANPMPAKSNAHMMHLLGEGFGCCWCCYLVWLLLLICVLMLLRIRKLNKMLDEQEELMEDYEIVLERHGLMPEVEELRNEK